MPTTKYSYYLAICKDDSPAYNLRARTMDTMGMLLANHGIENFHQPKQVTITFDSPLDLINQCLQEGGAYWESPNIYEDGMPVYIPKDKKGE